MRAPEESAELRLEDSGIAERDEDNGHTGVRVHHHEADFARRVDAESPKLRVIENVVADLLDDFRRDLARVRPDSGHEIHPAELRLQRGEVVGGSDEERVGGDALECR